MLSIDVDGQDPWIWEALQAFHPRRPRPHRSCASRRAFRRPAARHRAMAADRQTDFYGASIEALVALGERKGYRLVHSELTGNNAFFVRRDVHSG